MSKKLTDFFTHKPLSDVAEGAEPFEQASEKETCANSLDQETNLVEKRIRGYNHIWLCEFPWLQKVSNFN